MGLFAFDIFLFWVQMKYIFNRQDNTSCLQSEIIPETASYISTSDKYALSKISPILALNHVMAKVN